MARSPLVMMVLMMISLVKASSPSYNVQKLGAKADGTTDSTKAFLAAWSLACSSKVPATVYVPNGRFVLGRILLQGPCNNNAILVRIDGTLVAPSDYRVIASVGYWIEFQSVNGLTVSGGVLDGRGASLWACKMKSGTSCPLGATSLEISKSNNVLVSGLTSLNSQMFHIVIYASRNVKMQGMKISAPANSPNTDGIHVESSSGVTIQGARIATGDDCVSMGPGTTNMWVENVACGPGHGISIGSLGKSAKEAGVQNVTVKSVTFTGTQNGVRIKAWGRPSTGYARHILFQHITINGAQNPVLLDQNYCPGESNCPDQVSGVKISDVTYQDIHGWSATKVAVRFDCSKSNPCTGIRLKDVKLTYRAEPAQASCANADGTASGLVQPSSCL